MCDKHIHQQTIANRNRKSQLLPAWLLFLAFLAYVWATQPKTPIKGETLRLLIISVVVVIAILALAAAGAPELILEVLKLWLPG